MLVFWERVRLFLKEEYGQNPGKRDRERLALRQRLAERLGLDHKTLKAFLNGHQIGLGADALSRLFDLYPGLRDIHISTVNLAAGVREPPPSELTVPVQLELPLYKSLQLELPLHK